MSQDTLIKLQSTESKHIYWTNRKKNSKGAQNKDKLELKKFDPTIKKRVLYKQTKK
jgi:large subunit ribosomal protein L33